MVFFVQKHVRIGTRSVFLRLRDLQEQDTKNISQDCGASHQVEHKMEKQRDKRKLVEWYTTRYSKYIIFLLSRLTLACYVNKIKEEISTSTSFPVLAAVSPLIQIGGVKKKPGWLLAASPIPIAAAIDKIWDIVPEISTAEV